MVQMTNTPRHLEDHPREYGENVRAVSRIYKGRGSSPRIRGECSQCTIARVTARIIPANTGRIPPPWGGRSPRQDHPREYGENAIPAFPQSPEPGSSPRIRGESLCECRGKMINGIIPANTGRINASTAHHQRPWDHPREYGENQAGVESDEIAVGSSPRIRGELEPADSCVHGIGIIPANTGRIVKNPQYRIENQDHPREYGENLETLSASYPYGGSSPRIRGEYQTQRRTRTNRGIIPANTGRISSVHDRVSSLPDHPREYGENEACHFAVCDAPGSSPRIRGELDGEKRYS